MKTQSQIAKIILVCLSIFFVVFEIAKLIVCINWKLTYAGVSSEANFYSEAYNNLISIHVGLFTALVAVAIAVFGIQKWFEHKEIEELKNSLPNDILQIVKANKSLIIDEVNKTMRGKVDVEIEKKSLDYFKKIVDINLSLLSNQSDREKFCASVTKIIWKKYLLNSPKSEWLKFHMTLQNLLKEINASYPNGDADFKDVINQVKNKLTEFRCQNFVMSQQFSILIQEVNRILPN